MALKQKQINTAGDYRGRIERVSPDPYEGLNEEQVKARFVAGWNNRPVDSDTRSVKEIIRSNTLTYFNMIFVILAVLLAIVRSYRDMMFMGIIICNTLIGIVQELRSKKVLDELNIMNAVHAKVIRDAKRWEILTEDLVIDDIIELSTGNQIPADAVVLTGQIQVNEALLTGESDEVTKKEGSELMSGSFVVSGSCRARLTAVGEDSYISRLTLQATRQKGGEQSEMIRALDRLVKIVGVIIIPIGALLFYQQYIVLQSNFRDSITNMVAAIIGMIPEGLYLTASIALAVSAMRLAMQKVLIHDMKSIETLARVTVLCVDKTGTITEDHMEVKGVMTDIRPALPQGEAEISSRVASVLRSGQKQFAAIAEARLPLAETVSPAHEPLHLSGETVSPAHEPLHLSGENAPLAEKNTEIIAEVVEPGTETVETAAADALSASENAETAAENAVPAPENAETAAGNTALATGTVDNVVSTDGLASAGLSSDGLSSGGLSSAGVSSGENNMQEILGDFVHAMDPDNSTMRALQEYFPASGKHTIDQIVPFTSRIKYSGAMVDGTAYVLGAPEFLLGDDYELYQSVIEHHGESGYRVLAFGTYGGELDGMPLTRPVHLLGTILLANRVRPGAKDTFQYFAQREVAVKVISGDNPVSVSAIAREAGIERAEDYVDASTLQTDEDIAAAIKQYTVFGRVSPEQKRKFVKALQDVGETVAMTGDGVNDVLALKDADCSIAMAGGSEAASQVAQLVLLDGDFSKMPGVVLEGRRVVNNIERTASLFLVKNIFSLLLSVFSVILVMDYPLEAAQVSLISMFTIGIPAFILSQEPNRDPIRGHFLTNVLMRALPAGLTDFAIVLSLVWFCTEFGVDNESMSTACTLLVSLVGFMIMYRIMRPMNRIHWAILLSMIAGLIFSLFNARWFFGIRNITRQVAMLMIVFGIIAEPMMRYLGMLGDWILRRAYGNRPPKKRPKA